MIGLDVIALHRVYGLDAWVSTEYNASLFLLTHADPLEDTNRCVVADVRDSQHALDFGYLAARRRRLVPIRQGEKAGQCSSLPRTPWPARQASASRERQSYVPERSGAR